MSKQNSESVPQQMQPVYDEITRLTDAVCRDYVDEEFAMLCRKLAAALDKQNRPQTEQLASLIDEWGLRAWVREASREDYG